MTIEEVSEKYGVAISSLKNTFPRVQSSILKKHGVKILKEGRGAAAIYREEWEDDKRALTMYEETKNTMFMSEEQFRLANWEFSVFLGIITTPMLVFRGSYLDFLKYIEAPITDASIKGVQEGLKQLAAQDYISYQIDKTDPTYFVAALWRATETGMEIGMEMIHVCKRLADTHNKRSWVPLLKTWIGVQMMAEHQPYTMNELSSFTGLSMYQIRESCKVLQKSEIFKTSRAYSDYQRCIGTNVDLNVEAFFLLE